MALIIISSEDAKELLNEAKTESLDLQRTILEGFAVGSYVSMSTPRIFQFVKRKYPYITPHTLRKALDDLEAKHLLGPATYTLDSRIYPVSDFIGKCTLGHFTDDDGFGYLLTEDLEEGEEVFPSEVYRGYNPPGKFIVWYIK